MARRVATSDTIKESAQKAVPEMQNVSSVVQTTVVQTIVVQIIVVQTTVVPRNIQKGSELKLFLFDWQGVLEDQRAQEKIENQTS